MGLVPFHKVEVCAHNVDPVAVLRALHEAALQRLAAQDGLEVSEVGHGVGHGAELVVAPEQLRALDVEFELGLRGGGGGRCSAGLDPNTRSVRGGGNAALLLGGGGALLLMCTASLILPC